MEIEVLIIFPIIYNKNKITKKLICDKLKFLEGNSK